MNDIKLIENRNGEPRISSNVIAEKAGISHKAVVQLINKHYATLENFSLIEFQILSVEKSINSRGTKYQHVYYLNENQATLLLTFCKNTEFVIKFKYALVKAFSEAKQIIPLQSQRLREMQTELELLRLRNETTEKNKALLDMYGVEKLAILQGRTDQVIQIEKIITEQVIVNQRGEVLEKSNGIGITELTKELGFKNNKQCDEWLESIGYGRDSEHWKVEKNIVKFPKLPRNKFEELKRKYNIGTRQKKIGES